MIGRAGSRLFLSSFSFFGSFFLSIQCTYFIGFFSFLVLSLLPAIVSSSLYVLFVSVML